MSSPYTLYLIVKAQNTIPVDLIVNWVAKKLTI